MLYQKCIFFFRHQQQREECLILPFAVLFDFLLCQKVVSCFYGGGFSTQVINSYEAQIFVNVPLSLHHIS